MIHFLLLLSTSWKTEVSQSCVSAIACGSYIPQNISAPYGMVCHGCSVDVFHILGTQIEFEVTTEGVT